MTEIKGLHWEQDREGIVTATMDDPEAAVNTMNQTWVDALHALVARLEQQRDSISGVILASAKKSFFAGGDLSLLADGAPDTAARHTEHLSDIKAHFRRLERLGRPVVAAINGSALGGGLELALIAHHRIAVDDPTIRLGVPEVTLGLLPGGGGVTRLVRMLGLQRALSDWILPGTRYAPADAHAQGVISELVNSKEDLIPAAKQWIRANPEPVQPWDVPGFTIPGGSAATPQLAAELPAYPARLRQQSRGAPYPAPRAALAAAVEGSLVDFDTANLVETRYLVRLICAEQVTKNMIGIFFDTQKVNGGANRPAAEPAYTAGKVGVIGAGMMGAAIAYVCARAGIQVVLGDIEESAAVRGKGYAERLEARARQRGRTTEQQSAELLARITPTADLADLAGADLVIEAVFESIPLKQQVFAEIQHLVAPDAVLGSNTSSLPISTLADGLARPTDVIGIHFFSPADKMPLVEIVVGERTSDRALARAFDFVRQIRKTPIVVNDRRGFFTSRVIGRFIDEGVAALGEGVGAARIEQAALQAGYPTGPLQLLDELTLTLARKIRQETRAAVLAEGGQWQPHPAETVVDTMIDRCGRGGRSSGAGFYDYDDSGNRVGLWPGLAAQFGTGNDLAVSELQDRMLFAEAVDAIRCLDEGVLRSVADANIGSIQGIGFPAWTGGVLQFVNQYAGGPSGFAERCRELAAAYGPHFEPPRSLLELAATGRGYR